MGLGLPYTEIERDFTIDLICYKKSLNKIFSYIVEDIDQWRMAFYAQIGLREDSRYS